MSYRPAGCAAIDRTGRTIRRRGTWFRTDASAAKTTVIVPAMKRNISEGPPLSSAHAPAYGDTTPPMRPTATAVPMPVARMPVGYTCAASAYIVVRSEEHTSELQSHSDLVCRLLLEKKKARSERCHSHQLRLFVI